MNDTPYLSVQHNLNYHYNLKTAIEKFENTVKMDSLREKVIQEFMRKSTDNTEFYLNSEEISQLRYQSMIYENEAQTVRKLYFSSIYRLIRNENEVNTLQNVPKIYVGEEMMYFDNIQKFIDFVQNRTCNYKLNMYFKLILNKKKMTLQYNPYIYSIHFPYEPYYDTNIRQFNNYDAQTRKDILDNIIQEALENTESLTSGSIPMIFFKNCIFKMSNIDMREFSECFGKQFHPKFYGGKNTKYDPNSNAKESLNIIANNDMQMFIKNMEGLFENYIPMIKDTLLEMKKNKKINIKLSKKDDLKIKFPLTYHREIVQNTDSDDEDIHYVDDGKELYILNIKQSSSNENNQWDELPAKRVNYTIRNPYIFLNKLWYNNSENCMFAQFSFSRKLNILMHESKYGGEEDETFTKLMEEFEN
jgi:hypothetical protein